MIAMSLAVLTAFAAFAAEQSKQLPLPAKAIVERLKHHAPKHVDISAQNNELVIVISAAERKGGFEGSHSIDLKSIAGRTITIQLDIKVTNVKSGPNGIPRSIGKITFAGTTQNLVTSESDWKTYTFKNVKIPGNGLLKMLISLKNVSGEVRIRNPRISYRGISAKSRSSKNKSKKKKKNN